MDGWMDEGRKEGRKEGMDEKETYISQSILQVFQIPSQLHPFSINCSLQHTQSNSLTAAIPHLQIRHIRQFIG